MFDWLRYRYKLARLRLAHRKASIRLEEEYQRARKEAKSEEERDETTSPFMYAIDRQHDEEATLQSHYFLILQLSD